MDNMRGGARYWGTFDPPSVGSEDVNVRSWHLANNPAAVAFVRYWSDIGHTVWRVL